MQRILLQLNPKYCYSLFLKEFLDTKRCLYPSYEMQKKYFVMPDLFPPLIPSPISNPSKLLTNISQSNIYIINLILFSISWSKFIL
jgi:hypothetical protein